MRRHLVPTIALVISMFGVTSANAGLIVISNLNAGAYNSDWGLGVRGPAAINPITGAAWGYDRDRAVSFTPSANYSLDSISAALTHESGTNAIDLWLMSSDAAGLPGATLESWSFTGLPEFGTTNSTLAVGSSTLHPQLLAGVLYWVAVSANGDSAMVFNWNTRDPLVAGGARRIDGGPWSTDGLRDPAFQVEGTAVPDPASTLLLLGMSLTGLVAVRRRWR